MNPLSEGTGIEGAGAAVMLGGLCVVDCVCKSIFGGEGILGSAPEKFAQDISTH